MGERPLMKNQRHSLEKCLEEASQFERLVDWYRNHRSTYNFAVAKKWQRTIGKKLQWQMQTAEMSYEECRAKAAPYNRLVEWKHADDASYRYAIRRKWQRKIAGDLHWQIRPSYSKITLKQCTAIASDYSSLFEWRKQHPSTYAHACGKNWQRRIARALGWRLPGSLRSYTECQEIASNYGSLMRWRENDVRSYRYAVNRSWQKPIAKSLGWHAYARSES
jgi:hypothetical protein